MPISGSGITLLGIIGETQWGAERIAELKPGQSVSIRRYDLHFDGVTTRQGPNYRETAGHFTVRRNGEVIGVHGALEAHASPRAALRPPRPR